jgi:excisionase family DNA binding protein
MNTTFSNCQPEPLAYSIAEACRISSFGRSYLYKLIADGRLEARRLGARTFIPAASLRALLDGAQPLKSQG